MNRKRTHHTAQTTLLRLLALLALLLVAVAPARAAAGLHAAAPKELTSSEWTSIQDQLCQAGAPVPPRTTKLLAADGTASDMFGLSVAVSGDTVVVGAYWDDDRGTDSGSAYVFQRNQGGANNWGQVIKLTAADGAAGDVFGYAVAVDGDTIVVGAPNDDDNGSNSGSAYVFYRNQGGANNWGQVKKLTAADGAAGDDLGISVAIDGDTVVAGAIGDEASRGSAYLYGRHQGGTDNWGQVKKLTAADGVADDHLGISVGVSGDTVVAGAYRDDDKGSSSGSAYVFGRNQGGTDNWGQVRKLTAADGAASDMFGWSVALGGDTIVVGAWWDDDYGTDSGSAYVFYRHQGGTDNWGQVIKLTASDGAAYDNLGRSVAVSGDTVIVGAAGDDDKGSDSGSAYMYSRNEGGADNWGQVDKLTAQDGAAGDLLGNAVALDGDVIAIGAYQDDHERGNDAGAAYVIAPDILEWIVYLPLVRVWDMWVPW